MGGWTYGQVGGHVGGFRVHGWIDRRVGLSRWVVERQVGGCLVHGWIIGKDGLDFSSWVHRIQR